jgi:hypothetical protein
MVMARGRSPNGSGCRFTRSIARILRVPAPATRRTVARVSPLSAVEKKQKAPLAVLCRIRFGDVRSSAPRCRASRRCCPCQCECSCCRSCSHCHSRREQDSRLSEKDEPERVARRRSRGSEQSAASPARCGSASQFFQLVSPSGSSANHPYQDMSATKPHAALPSRAGSSEPIRRKKRASQLTQRNGRIPIARRRYFSTAPCRCDRNTSELPQCGQTRLESGFISICVPRQQGCLKLCLTLTRRVREKTRIAVPGCLGGRNELFVRD